jgi:hypothetical protein
MGGSLVLAIRSGREESFVTLGTAGLAVDGRGFGVGCAMAGVALTATGVGWGGEGSVWSAGAGLVLSKAGAGTAATICPQLIQ